MENKPKFNFIWKLIISILIILLLIFCIYCFEKKNRQSLESQFIVLYSGYPLDNTKIAVQDLSEIELTRNK